MANMSSSMSQPDSDKKAQFIARLYTEIEISARAKDFSRANSLRNKLMEVAPTALKEIISSADIIENEKSAGIDRDHLAVWDHLYSTLTSEEQNGLFYSMTKIVIPPKKAILSLGAYNTRLFFIDRGRVAIIVPRNEKNTVLAQLGTGNLLGEYSFTSISLCSATAVSASEVSLYCLENSATDHWNEQYPGLYQKITDFCLKHGSIGEIASRKLLENKEKPRYPISAPVKATLLDKNEQPTKTAFGGQLSDISLGGCAIDIKLSKKATARALLAKKLRLNFSLPIEDENMDFELMGKIVKVSFLMLNDYSLHLQFTTPISQSTLGKIIKEV